jgi:hypothetical protein
MESLTSKVKQALSHQGEVSSDGTGHTFKSEDGSFPSNHRAENRFPNPSEEDFDKALDEFREIVGRTCVEIVDINKLMDQPRRMIAFTSSIRPSWSRVLSFDRRIQRKSKLSFQLPTSIRFPFGLRVLVGILATVEPPVFICN